MAAGKRKCWRKGQAGERSSEDTRCRQWIQGNMGGSAMGPRRCTGTNWEDEGQAGQQEEDERGRGGGGRAGEQETKILKVCYTNTQSILGKINELTAYIVETVPDIVLICETWCNSEVNNASLTIPGYQLETDLRRDRNDTRNGIGGGLLVYTRLGVEVLPCDKLDDKEFNQFCSFYIKTKGEPLQIVLAYRPPSSGMENVDRLCEILRSLDKNSILIGDINIPGIDWNSGRARDARGRALMETIEEESLCQLVSFATHNKGNTLDLVITNNPENIVAVYPDTTLGKSDHCIINVEIVANKVDSNKAIKRPNWAKMDVEGLKRELGDKNWQQILSGKTVEEDWAHFRKILDAAVSRHVPVSTVRAENQPKWITREIIRLIRKKRRAWRTMRVHLTVENREKYKELEKQVTIRVRNAKRSMEKRLANSKNSNARTFANYIKSKTKSRTGIGPLKTKEGKMVTREDEIAELLNNFFASVFTEEDIMNLPHKEEETEARLDTISITTEMIREKIKNLKENSAPGPDGITPTLLKGAREELLVPLKIIYNKSLQTGQVPKEWREALVTPIFKKGAKGDTGNYRPVSLTSIPCKIMESVLKDHIMDHIEQHRLLKETQHGFMKGKSCATNLVVFLNKLTEIVDEGKSADVFYLDFSKAFDKVPRERLLLKLAKKGITGKVLGWIRAWLTGRTQVVKVGEAKSTESEVKSGVPQGSVLGPPLFDVFIDDVDECAVLIDLLLKFADDTKGMQQIKVPEDRAKLQQTLDKLVEWAARWGMSFNVAKCKIMHVGTNNPCYKYTMCGEELVEVDEEKDIGVVITKNLKPTKQCKKAAGTANAVLQQLTKNFHYRDRHVFRKLYIQYVRPHLEFATPAWSPWAEGDKLVLEKVQMKAVAMVSGLQGKNYSDRCKELCIETLEARRNKQDLLHAHRIINEGETWSGNMFTKAQTGAERITRGNADPNTLKIPRARLDVRKHSYAVRAAESWNRLAADTKAIKEYTAFKNTI